MEEPMNVALLRKALAEYEAEDADADDLYEAGERIYTQARSIADAVPPGTTGIRYFDKDGSQVGWSTVTEEVSA
jgi:hypothetical protein